MSTKLPSVKSGDTWKFSFVWSTNNTPIDLSGCSGKMQIRDSAGSLAAAATSVTIVGSTGTVNVVFSSAVTALIPAGSYKSDLQLTFADGTVQSSSTVVITVEAGITE